MSHPMTFDELAEIYRQEMNGIGLTPVRTDLYHAMSELVARLEDEYKAQYVNPSSIEYEAAEHRLKSAKRLRKEVVRMRAAKIANRSFVDAKEDKSDYEGLACLEDDYYCLSKALTRTHFADCMKEGRP